MKKLKKLMAAVCVAAAAMTATVSGSVSVNANDGLGMAGSWLQPVVPIIYYTTAVNGLNVRNASGNPIGSLSYNTPVCVTGKVMYNGDSLWRQIEWYGDYAYVSGEFLSITEDNYYRPEPTPQPVYNQPYYMVASVAYGYLALRSAPTYDYANEIGQFEDGDYVKVLNYNAAPDYAWVEDQYGRQGYVNKWYLA